jgi:hypothetical protein
VEKKEGEAGRNWNWMEAAAAVLRVRVEGEGPRRFKIRSMRRRRNGDLWIHDSHRTEQLVSLPVRP